MYKPKRKPSKLTFEGLTIVMLPDDCTREATRFFRLNTMTAVLQRNGNVGLSRTGIFEHPHSPRPKLRVAQCLHGLKLLSAEILARYQALYDASEHDLEVGRLIIEAEDLGYKIVKLKTSPKCTPTRK